MEVNERPMASPLARFQVAHGFTVANLRQVNVEIEDEIGRQLLRLLDGTRDRESLLQDLTTAISSGDILQNEDGTAVKDVGKIRSMLSRDLEKNLQKMARLALLVS